MRLITGILCSSAWLVSLAASAEPASEHRARIASWLQGQFTNYQQSLLNPEQAMSPLLYVVQPMPRQEEEGTLLSSQQMFLFNPEQKLRTQVYELRSLRGEAVEQAFYHVNGPLDERGSWQPLHGCEVEWHWQGDHYTGLRDEDTCYFYNQETGNKVALKSQLKLTRNTFAATDWAYAEDGTLLLGEAFNSHLVLQRMKFFDAAIEYRAPGSDTWRTVRPTQDIHDQGVRVRLQLPDSDLELRYQLELVRQGEQRVLRIYQGNQAQPVKRVEAPVENGQLDVTLDQLRVRLTARN